MNSVYSKCIAFTYSIGDIGILKNRIAFGGASNIRTKSATLACYYYLINYLTSQFFGNLFFSLTLRSRATPAKLFFLTNEIPTFDLQN